MEASEHPGSGPDPDREWQEYTAWLDREIAVGRDPVPAEWEIQGPAVSVSLGDAVDVDPALLAAICGPDGLGGQSLGPQFAQDQSADVLRPGPVLAALTEQAASDPGRLADDELIGVLRASRRLEAREAYKQAVLTAEFARRREASFAAAGRRGVAVGCRPGAFPGEELAIEMVTTRGEASRRIDTATDLATRLPATLAGMADGLIDEARANVISFYTCGMTRADAARADEILAAVAPGLRVDQLARRAAALEMKLAPEAAMARKEHARNTARRVEARREVSGNASLAGREMDTADVMASMAYLSAIAARLRSGGLDGSIGALRALAMADLTQGRDPLDRITPRSAPSTSSSQSMQSDTSSPADTGPGQARPQDGRPQGGEHSDSEHSDSEHSDSEHRESRCGDEDPGDHRPGAGADPSNTDPSNAGPGDADSGDGGSGGEDPGDGGGPGIGSPGRDAEPIPLPALINLTIPAGTLLGWSTAPGQAGSWGLLDSEEIRAIIRAAARHPRTRWCFTITGPDGTATAHGCAPGRHPPHIISDLLQVTDLLQPPEPRPPGSRGDIPAPGQAAALARLIACMKPDFQPITRTACDHALAEDRYTPSRSLTHLARARNATCAAPGCSAQAVFCDLDHTTPYPDGPTCPCNLAPLCRRHHRAKQAPDWQAGQATPGTIRWTLPSGRTHATGPTSYDT